MPITQGSVPAFVVGTEVVPVLRREMEAGRPAHLPDAPTHTARVAAHRTSSNGEVADSTPVTEGSAR